MPEQQDEMRHDEAVPWRLTALESSRATQGARLGELEVRVAGTFAEIEGSMKLVRAEVHGLKEWQGRADGWQSETSKAIHGLDLKMAKWAGIIVGAIGILEIVMKYGMPHL